MKATHAPSYTRSPRFPARLASDLEPPHLHIAYSGLECGVALLVALFAFYACVVVCRSRVRVRTLRTLRFLLSFFLFWWVVASLTSGVAFWEVVLSASNWSPHERKEIVCEVYIVASFGFVEPMVLILVCGIFYRKLSKSVAAALRGSTPPPVGKRRRRKARPPAPLRCKWYASTRAVEAT